MLLLLGDVREQIARLTHVGAHSDRLAERVDAHSASAAHHLLVECGAQQLRPPAAATGTRVRSGRADDNAAGGEIHAAA